MNSIAIEIPNMKGKHDIEVEVKIDGVKHNYNYRVDVFYWEDCDEGGQDKAACIKKIVSDYDSEWELAHIGMPTAQYIPITFQKKLEEEETL